jgi:hypothetical protein
MNARLRLEAGMKAVQRGLCEVLGCAWDRDAGADWQPPRQRGKVRQNGAQALHAIG